MNNVQFKLGLLDLLLNLTPEQFAWIQKVQAESWTDGDFSTSAREIFAAAASVGVGHSVAYKIVKAAVESSGIEFSSQYLAGAAYVAYKTPKGNNSEVGSS